LQAFNILLQIGAGTGLIFILRWFWWRINAYSEITAMDVSFLIAVYFQFVHPYTNLPALGTGMQLVIGVGITTAAWLLVTFLTAPENTKTLVAFYNLVFPGGPGWKRILIAAENEGIPIEEKKKGWDVPHGILAMVLGCFAIYSALFATGNWIYGKYQLAAILSVIFVISTYLLTKTWSKLKIR
ncbi:MAG: hypothetical protein K9G47_05510, partial [Bacteroidales bacterium]|nr:hypothetical protein [Bacteroidales bacterium]